MISRFHRSVPAMVCMGATLVLLGCEKSSSDGDGEASAAAVSLATANDTDVSQPSIVPTIISASANQTVKPPATTQPTLVSDKHIVIAEPAAHEEAHTQGRVENAFFRATYERRR